MRQNCPYTFPAPAARYYNSALSLWLSVDPLADKYPNLSPYTYCADNPVGLVDPDGREIDDGIFLDEFGNVLGNDGIDDGKLYVIKTKQSIFENNVKGAGLSEEAYRNTTEFIRNNSGQTEEFKKNNIAYENCVEIEGNEKNRGAMKRIVQQDDVAGFLYGGKAKWNREYGGTNENGIIIEHPKGSIGTPKIGASISIPSTEKTRYSFHSHCSGWAFLNGTLYGYVQSPSQTDVNSAVGTDYVFGRGNNTVYIYNRQGVQATLPMKAF